MEPSLYMLQITRDVLAVLRDTNFDLHSLNMEMESLLMRQESYSDLIENMSKFETLLGSCKRPYKDFLAAFLRWTIQTRQWNRIAGDIGIPAIIDEMMRFDWTRVGLYTIKTLQRRFFGWCLDDYSKRHRPLRARMMRLLKKCPKPVLGRASVQVVECCSICYERDSDVVTACGHQFHEKCLHEWMKHGTSCPYCRTKINPATVQGIKRKLVIRKRPIALETVESALEPSTSPCS